MNYLTFFSKLRNFFVSVFLHIFKSKTLKVSLLIPFSTNDPSRKANFEWLLEYWNKELPDAEIVIGKCRSEIFCKAEALNDAARRSKGKVLVILDADAYLEGQIISDCADKIIENVHNNLWFVPYRRLYRLTKEASKLITDSDPKNPFRIPTPVADSNIENAGNAISYGHRYGAMLMMFHKRAYRKIGGFDERFKGWGGEDVCLLRALDTLYGKHKTTDSNIYHLWHPFIGANYEQRRWDGQPSGGSNWTISKEYSKAFKNPAMMKELLAGKKL
jgi:hypothetical protein